MKCLCGLRRRTGPSLPHHTSTCTCERSSLCLLSLTLNILRSLCPSLVVPFPKPFIIFCRSLLKPLANVPVFFKVCHPKWNTALQSKAEDCQAESHNHLIYFILGNSINTTKGGITFFLFFFKTAPHYFFLKC